MKKWFLLSLVFQTTLSFSADNYCVGIRGNGELAPAHWGGMSRIIESKGLPQSVAGGSSAAITMFMLDAISRNHLYTEENKNLEQALLLKSLVPHIFYLIREDVKVPVLMRLMSNITGLKDGGFINILKKAIRIARDFDTFMEVLGEYGKLLNPDIVIGLKENFGFYKNEIATGIKVFGAFDAEKDMAILFRKGLVDFKQAAIVLGRVADFYAGYADVEVNRKLDRFIQSCAAPSKGKLWKDLVASHPECQTLFENSLSEYYTRKTEEVRAYRFQRKIPYKRTVKLPRNFPNKMVFEKVGSGLNAFPTTSVIIGDAVSRYNRLLKDYEQSRGSDYDQFTLDFQTEIKYGYWGRTNELANIATNLKSLYPDDFKSSRFEAMKDGIWFEALATSPAEPGLSSVLRIPDGRNIDPSKVIGKKYFYKSFFGLLPSLKAIPWFHKTNPTKGVIPFREGVLSAGGWNDLHPTLVLQAKGCKDITYLTRQGGESVFGQQIFIRLSGYTDTIDFWTDIRDHNRDGWTGLTPEVEASPWNNLYNLMNPKSSFNKSISAATAVYCTDWDSYNVLGGQIEEVLDDAYNAPVFVNNEDYRDLYNFGGDPEGKSPDGFPGCILKQF